MPPRLSISTSFAYCIPIERQIAMAAEAGFHSISLGANLGHSGYADPAKRLQLKAALRQYAMAVDSVHAPGLDRLGTVAEAECAAEAAADLGAGCVIAHGGPFECNADGFGDRLSRLIDTCSALIPLARRTGVVFALENVAPGPATDLVREALVQLDDGVFGLCYDSAHDQIDGPRPLDLLDEFGGRVFAVHISDRIRPYVDHVIPGEGFIDWAGMCAGLRSARFTGPIVMEVMMEHSRFRTPLLFLREAFRAGASLRDSIYKGPA